jgi:hypothetical protein
MEDETIEIDLDGKVVGVPRDVVGALAAAAAPRAHVSGPHRDLSLQLGRALESGRVSLGQSEIRALCAMIEEEHPDRFGPAAAELLRAVA